MLNQPKVTVRSNKFISSSLNKRPNPINDMKNNITQNSNEINALKNSTEKNLSEYDDRIQTIEALAFATDKSFIYNQQSPSDRWRITHNLNKHPSVTIINSAKEITIGDVEYVNENILIINFSAAFSGKAFLN